MTKLKVGLVCFPFIGLRIALYRAFNLCPCECEPPTLSNVLAEAGIKAWCSLLTTYMLPKPTSIMLTVLPPVKAKEQWKRGTLDIGRKLRMGLCIILCGWECIIMMQVFCDKWTDKTIKWMKSNYIKRKKVPCKITGLFKIRVLFMQHAKQILVGKSFPHLSQESPRDFAMQ